MTLGKNDVTPLATVAGSLCNRRFELRQPIARRKVEEIRKAYFHYPKIKDKKIIKTLNQWVKRRMFTGESKREGQNEQSFAKTYDPLVL
jgi:hypothetical protein